MLGFVVSRSRYPGEDSGQEIGANDEAQPTTKRPEWCAYCGERFGSASEAITVTFEGEDTPIHRKEHTVYMERGLLKYRDGPRTGRLSEFAVEMIILFTGIATVIFWLSLQLMWRW